MFFRLKTGNKVRGHNWPLAKDHFKLDIRKFAFSQRTVNEWNKLPGKCVNATSVNMFKNKLDDYFRRTRLTDRLITKSIENPGHSISQGLPCSGAISMFMLTYVHGLAVQLNPVKSSF